MSRLTRATIYLDPDLHKALKLKSIELSRSVSDLVNEAVRGSLAEDSEDLAVLTDRVNETSFGYDNMVKKLKIKSGGSRDIRIPRKLFDKAKLGNEVDIEVNNKQITIRPVKNVREGWEEQFILMAKRGDDRLLDPEIITHNWDEKEWEW